MQCRFLRPFSVFCISLLVACGGGGGDSGTSTAVSGASGGTTTSADVARVVITPATPVISVAGTVLMDARSFDANGNNVPGSWIFRSSDPTVATVSERGPSGWTVTGVAEGFAAITATDRGIVGSASVQVRGRADIQVTGRVVDGQTQAGIGGAQVSFNNSQTNTAADGAYSFSVPFATSTNLRVTAARTGYASTTLAAVITPPSTELQPILLVKDTGLRSGISGAVRNARDNQPIASAMVFLYPSQGIIPDSAFVAQTSSDSGGGYSFVGLNPGTYTVVATAVGFSECQRTAISLSGNDARVQDVSCSPVGVNEIRIVLTWGENPRDLDAHLTGPNADPSRFHVYYPSVSRGNTGASPFAKLDVDDTSSFGPETITITRLNSGAYRYSVHDYTNRNVASTSALGNSGAKVELYTPANAAPTTFFVPNQSGNLWTVFELSGDIRNPTVTRRNDMGNVADESTIP